MSDESFPRAQRPHAPFWRMALLFLLALATLQGGWSALRGSAAERAVIDVATVGTAVALVNRLTPEVAARAHGARIQAAGGGINVLNGCEGTEVLFLLWAALLAAPLSWQWRVQGAVLGAVWVFALNQVRLLALFYSYRSNRPMFDLLHGLVAPAVLVAATLLFVAWVHRRHGALPGQARPGGAGGADAL